MAQSNHATALFAREHPESFNEWFENSQYIALLEIDNEDKLLKLASKLERKGVKVSIFREPDMNNEATSIAVDATETARRQTSNLKLAMKDYYDLWAKKNNIESDPVSNYQINYIKNNIVQSSE